MRFHPTHSNGRKAARVSGWQALKRSGQGKGKTSAGYDARLREFMSMRRRSVNCIIVVFSTLVGAAVTWACEVIFGTSTLDSRKDTVLAAPSVEFTLQLESLVNRPHDNLKAVESSFDDDNREEPESVGLSPEGREA